MFVCVCHALRESELKEIVSRNGCRNLDDLAGHTPAGSQCGCCLMELEAALLPEDATDVELEEASDKETSAQLPSDKVLEEG